MNFHRLIFFIFILCCSQVVHAQIVDSDNLAMKLKNARTISEKAEIYFKTGDELVFSDTVQAVAYVQKGLALVKEDLFYQGVGYFYLGRVYMEFSPKKAATAFDNAIHFFQQISTRESYLYQSRTWTNKAVMAQAKGDNATYINLCLEKGIPLAAKGGDSLRVADGYTNVALPFLNYQQYDKAILYLDKAAIIFKKLAPNDLRQVDVYSNLAKIYILQDQLTEAGNNLQRAASVLKQEPTSLYAPNYHTIESMYLIRLKKWKDAEQSIDKGLAIAEKYKNRSETRQLLYQKAMLYNGQENWLAAKKVLLKMYEEGYIELITDKQKLFKDLAKLENELGNFQQAYQWMVKQNEVSEQAYAQQTKEKIADLETKYNFSQKEKELLSERAKAEKQKQIVWLTILSAAIALVGLYFWYRNTRLRAVQKLKQQQQIELGKALLEGEERERRRVARDLHDGLGGMLAGIKLTLSLMIEQRENLEKKELKQTVDGLGYSVSELRRISRNMMPEALLQAGLEIALKDFCAEATLPGLKVNFNAFNLHENFEPSVKLMIYRIIQELVYNALKHAEASKVMVQCSQSENFFFITVEDNGKGFLLNTIPNTSQGLRNIRNRVQLLNGKIDIETSAEGTNINIELYVGQ